MLPRTALLCAAIAWAPCAMADTACKYQDASGRPVHAYRPMPALEVIEAFELHFPEPAAVPGAGRCFNALL